MTGYEDQVRDYLRYCKKAAAELKLQGSRLDPKHHPTEAGACKLVFHRTPAEAEEIRAEFREAVAEGTPGRTPLRAVSNDDNRRNQPT